MRFSFIRYLFEGHTLTRMLELHQPPRPANEGALIPNTVLISAAIISGGIVIPPHTWGPA
jgi:hypothetical protein